MDLEEAKKLHAACYDVNLSIEETRLMLYIHSKVRQGIDLQGSCETEIQALCVMLGLSDLGKDLSKLGIKSDLSGVGGSIAELDKTFKAQCGIEAYMGGQLNDQLRFHVDSEYRKKYLNIYDAKVRPIIGSYDDAKIAQAFERFSQKENEAKRKFEDSLD